MNDREMYVSYLSHCITNARVLLSQKEYIKADVLLHSAEMLLSERPPKVWMKKAPKSLTQQHLKRYPDKINRFNKVHIWSDQWKMYWRSNYSGYTDDILKAGVYDAKDAFDHTIHCGPEKKIVLISAEAIEE